MVRLKDVANVTLGADDYESKSRLRRQAGGLYRHPGCAGGQSARSRARLCISSCRTSSRNCPQGSNGEIVYDSTDFVNARFTKSMRTLVEALLIVMLVVFAVPRFAALGAHSDHRHPAVADRHAHHHAGAWLFDQSADPAGAGAWQSVLSSTMPSSWSKTSTAISRKAWRRFQPPSQAARELGGPDHRHDRGARSPSMCRSASRAV